ncbi:hypothetical protein ACFYN0_31080, partial [Streptomyces sp. NPDC006704]
MREVPEEHQGVINDALNDRMEAALHKVVVLRWLRAVPTGWSSSPLPRRLWTLADRAVAALDAISFGVILRQSGVVTTGLVQRMVPDGLWE